MNISDITVKYLGHSSWVVETGNRVLVFDYGKIPRKHNAAFHFEDYKDREVILFFSHSHDDHYDLSFHRNSQKYNNVKSVLGGFSSKLSNTISINPHESMESDGLKVFASRSTDAGVSFLIVSASLVIFFAGDHAAWGAGDEANKLYYSEIDYIKSLGYKTDLAFIPVCTFSGKRPPDITKGAIYAIDALNPAVTFPMHANGNETVYRDFYKDFMNTGGKKRLFALIIRGRL